MLKEIGSKNVIPVSVITPCYKCKDTIGLTINSIVAQTHLPSEIILVDDCSPDDTLHFLNSLAGHYHKDWIKVLSLPRNKGPGAARNAGWELAVQPYIAFIDADDAWHPDKLNIQYHWMAEHPFASMSGHQCSIGMPDRLTRYQSGKCKFRPVNRYNMLMSNLFPTPSVMLKRELLNRFDSNKRYSEDYLLWLELIFSGCSVWRLDFPLAYTFKADFGVKGLSANLWQMEKGELDCYLKLYRKKHLSAIILTAIVPFSISKFIRRLIVTQYITRKFQF